MFQYIHLSIPNHIMDALELDKSDEVLHGYMLTHDCKILLPWHHFVGDKDVPEEIHVIDNILYWPAYNLLEICNDEDYDEVYEKINKLVTFHNAKLDPNSERILA